MRGRKKKNEGSLRQGSNYSLLDMIIWQPRPTYPSLRLAPLFHATSLSQSLHVACVCVCWGGSHTHRPQRRGTAESLALPHYFPGCFAPVRSGNAVRRLLFVTEPARGCCPGYIWCVPEEGFTDPGLNIYVNKDCFSSREAARHGHDRAIVGRSGGACAPHPDTPN